MAKLNSAQTSDIASRRTSILGRARRGLVAVALSAVAFAWAGEAEAHQEVSDWNAVMAQMEPLSAFFMHTRLSALLHVAIHDAMNSIPNAARYETYGEPVDAECGASPRAALAAAGRTMLIKYIDYYTNPNLPPPFYNPSPEDIRPEVETIYDAQLAAIPNGPAKTEGIRVGKKVARKLWNERLHDGWNNEAGFAWEWPNTDGDNDPMTGDPGQYVML